jgi:hypothetical protein
MPEHEPAKFLLYRGDTFLGTITHDPTLDDWPWSRGSFAAAEAYSSVKHLFDEERRLMSTSQHEEFDKIWKRIREPGLRMQLVDTDRVLSGGLIHIDGERVSWRTMRES